MDFPGTAEPNAISFRYNGFDMLRGLLFALFLQAPATPDLQTILAHIAEQAEKLKQIAPHLVAEETFEQRALKPRSRFRARGENNSSPDPSYRTRQIISEYSLGAFQTAPGALHEFRKVVSVDGKEVSAARAARQALSLGLRSPSDRDRKRMLEEFQKHGLQGAVVDFGPLLLLFTKSQADHYRFQLRGRGHIGAEPVVVMSYEQVAGDEALLVFQGRQIIREQMQGQIFIRPSDNMPLRVTMNANRTQGSHQLREEASVDYVPNPHGCLTPVSVVHRSYYDDTLTVEDVFHYTPFKKFEADTEIQFKPLSEPRP
jgi:hypothetical protein